MKQTHNSNLLKPKTAYRQIDFFFFSS
uniref:Uncharacterized protein n=1 Tax=Rhizophora mucronata TaxID=61149 RepID=A0A2P2QFP3_RHIMU